MYAADILSVHRDWLSVPVPVCARVSCLGASRQECTAWSLCFVDVLRSGKPVLSLLNLLLVINTCSITVDINGSVAAVDDV